MSIIHNQETAFWYNHQFAGRPILCPVCQQILTKENLDDLDADSDKTEWTFRCKCHQVFVLIVYHDIDDYSDYLK